jgi:hypothetical protein
MTDNRTIAAVLLIGALCLTVPAAAAAQQQTADITDLSLNGTADMDGDGNLSAATLQVDVDTTCRGCYDSGGLIGDPTLNPVVEISTAAGRSTTVTPPRADSHTVRQNLATLVNVVEQDTATVTVTLYDDDPVGRDRIASDRLTVAVESAAADHAPNRTAVQPKTGPPSQGATYRGERFQFVYENMSLCGVPCGEATGTVRTVGNTTAANVTVEVRLRAGDAILWTDDETIGTLGANEPYLTTQRLHPGPRQMSTIARHDRRVAIVIEVRSDDYHEVLTVGRRVPRVRT